MSQKASDSCLITSVYTITTLLLFQNINIVNFEHLNKVKLAFSNYEMYHGLLFLNQFVKVKSGTRGKVTGATSRGGCWASQELSVQSQVPSVKGSEVWNAISRYSRYCLIYSFQNELRCGWGGTSRLTTDCTLTLLQQDVNCGMSFVLTPSQCLSFYCILLCLRGIHVFDSLVASLNGS